MVAQLLVEVDVSLGAQLPLLGLWVPVVEEALQTHRGVKKIATETTTHDHHANYLGDQQPSALSYGRAPAAVMQSHDLVQ